MPFVDQRYTADKNKSLQAALHLTNQFDEQSGSGTAATVRIAAVRSAVRATKVGRRRRSLQSQMAVGDTLQKD